MSHDAHDRTEFQPQDPQSAHASGVVADPPGRSPSEVDDSALRRNLESASTSEDTEAG